MFELYEKHVFMKQNKEHTIILREQSKVKYYKIII